MGRLTLFIVFLVCVQSVSASGFSIKPADVFPSCVLGKDSDFSNVVRCGCEFMVPNFHLQGIANMFVKEIVAVIDVLTLPFKILGSATSKNEDAFKCIAYEFQQKWEGKIDLLAPVTDCPYVGTDKSSDTATLIMDTIIGLITPFLVVVFLFALSFTQTYLILGLAYTGWTLVIKKGTPSPKEGMLVIVLGIVILLLGSVWLLGSDLGLYAPLVVF